MAESPKKKVSISIKRSRPIFPRIVITTGFKLRLDKSTGILDVYLEASGGQKGERVGLDPNILASNIAMLKRYTAALLVEPDDAAQKEEILVSEQTHFANILHCSNLGPRSETIFGVFSIADWVESARGDAGPKPEVMSFDSVVSISSPALQKKLVMEIILQVEKSKE